MGESQLVGRPNRKSIRINTHRDGLQASCLLHGKQIKFFSQESNEICDKITGPQQLTPRLGNVSVKITEGDVRPLTPRKSVCDKITYVDTVTPSPRFGSNVSGK